MMNVASLAMAFGAHAFEQSGTEILDAVIRNPSGGIAYFWELGMETSAIWIPVLLIAMIYRATLQKSPTAQTK